MAEKGYTKKRNQELIDIVGANIRRIRKAKGLTMVKLANQCNIEAKMLYSYEYGKVDISISMLSLVALYLEVDTCQLLTPYQEK